jgi:hypothetical protein
MATFALVIGFQEKQTIFLCPPKPKMAYHKFCHGVNQPCGLFTLAEHSATLAHDSLLTLLFLPWAMRHK